MEVDTDDIADGWIAEHTPPNIDLPDDYRQHTYYDELADLVRANPQVALEVVLKMLFRTTDEEVISNIAAGPLEDLIARNGQLLIDRIEAEAKQNGRLRYALRGVWRNQSTEEVWKRIELARSVP